ncbi:MAG: hypothetical protein U0401_05520 [Anaerolineae bacterium]
MTPAARLSTLARSVIRDMTRLALKHGAVNLSQGYPDFDPPCGLLRITRDCHHSGYNQYAITWGAPNLRRQIAELMAAGTDEPQS